MNKLLVSVLCVLALFAAMTSCFAGSGKRGIGRRAEWSMCPNDSGKWYISVVGDAADARYNEVVGWFATNPSLAKLKSQVHFCPLTTATKRFTRNATPGNVRGSARHCGCRSRTAPWSTRLPARTFP